MPEEADTVRRIFRAYLEGYSPAYIARQLQEEGIPTPTGGSRWHASTIASILRNEKYCGDLLLQKYFTQDYLTHKIVRNSGQLPQYFVEDHHEPIVPKEVFNRVQSERARRSALRSDPAKLRFGNKRALQGRLICGYCGRVLKRCTTADGSVVAWQCCVRSQVLPDGGEPWCADDCGLRSVNGSAIEHVILTVLNELPNYRGALELARARLTWGELTRLDGLIERLEKQNALFKDSVGNLPNEDCDEEEDVLASAAQAAYAAGRQRLAALQIERAKHAHREMQLHMLFELADQLGPQPTAAPSEGVTPACYAADDFYARTRYVVPAELLSCQHQLAHFEDTLVVRYLSKVVITNEHLKVYLKAGFVASLSRTPTDGETVAAFETIGV